MVDYESRKVFWSKMGNELNTTDYGTALERAGLNYNVVERPVFVENHIVPNFKATMREDNKQVLGVVGNNYQIIQNIEAFDFINYIKNDNSDLTFIKGGLIKKTKCFLVCKTNEIVIGDKDRIDIYFLFMNSFDRSSSLIGALTPIRIHCANTIAFALRSSYRKWSINHCRNAEDKIKEAGRIIADSNNYIEDYKKELNNLINIEFKISDIDKILKNIFKTESLTELKKERINQLQNEIKLRFNESPDLQNYRNTAYAFINAVSDFEHHTTLKSISNETHFLNTVNGGSLTNKVYNLIAS